MRRTADTSGAGIGRRAALAVGLAGTVLLGGCGTQVSGTALPPTAQISTAGTVAGTSSGPVITAPSTSGSGDPTGADESSSARTTTSDDGTAESATASSTTAESTAQTTSASGGTAIDPATFAARLRAAASDVKSLRGSIAVSADTVDVSGTFGETISGGHVTALDMSMFLSSGSTDIPLRILIVGGKVYVGGATLLKSLGAGTKTWALSSKTSPNTTLRTMASQLDGYLTTASANQYELYALAARSIVDGGPARVGAVSAHRYDVTVDVAALAKASPASAGASMAALARAGVSTLPASLWLDASGRLLQSESTVKVSGVSSKSRFRVTGYNVPVTIKAPATADVFTG